MLSLLAAVAVYFVPETFGQRFYSTIEEIENDSGDNLDDETELQNRSTEAT